MPRRKKSEVSQPPVEEPIDEQPIEGRVVKRPDGYYWEAKGVDARGPFATRAEAEADLLAGGANTPEFDGEDSLQDAESEIGISNWIDPDTGGPAEDSVPHIEDH
jgi:hypothetical protein